MRLAAKEASEAPGGRVTIAAESMGAYKIPVTPAEEKFTHQLLLQQLRRAVLADRKNRIVAAHDQVGRGAVRDRRVEPGPLLRGRVVVRRARQLRAEQLPLTWPRS